MSARLSDLIAPPWEHTFGDVRYRMRPLSLLTFAELEGLGVSLDTLTAGDLEVWVRMYAYLAGLDPVASETLILKNMHTDPLGFKLFQEVIRTAFAGSEEGEGPTVYNRRRVQDPREAEKSEGRGGTDMSFLIAIARQSGIPLSDLLRMTFRGLHAVQASLQDMPMTNPMAALGMGGAGPAHG